MLIRYFELFFSNELLDRIYNKGGPLARARNSTNSFNQICRHANCDSGHISSRHMLTGAYK